MDDGQLIMSMIAGLIGVLIGVGIFVLILLASRELTAWYFKTNDIIKLLKQIAEQETE